MSLLHELNHVLVTFAFSVLFILVLEIKYTEIPFFLLIALISNRLPAMDARLHLGHRNPLFHSFLIPLLIALIAPRNAILNAFFVGFTAHMVADLNNPKQEWVWIKQKVGIILLWVSFFVLIGLIFGVNPIRAMKLFG